MPVTSTRQTLSRQWELLKLLPSRGPGYTSAELKNRLHDAGHQASKRTVERDLVDLSQLFPLQCNDKGMPYGWYWTPGSSAELPGISLSEALTLRLVEKSIRPLIPSAMLKSLEPRFNQARQKLKAISDENPSARWLDKVASVQPALTLLPPEINSDYLETLQQALLADQQISCRYYSAHKNQTYSFNLNPLALVQRGQITYLIATAEPFADIRQFVLHRFEDAQRLTTSSIKPEGFNLAQYIASDAMQFGTQDKIRLQAWVTDSLARLIKETPISDDMQLVKDEDGSSLTATVTNSWELQWWILSHSGSIVVRGPESLRAEIKNKLQRALEQHNAVESSSFEVCSGAV